MTNPGSTPDRWIFFLHGILGSGANWRSFGRQIVSAEPSWGAVLVDLRLHGESQTGFSPPHTVRAAAEDVAQLMDSFARTARTGRHAVLAHSFGGKVAIELARDRSGELAHLFVIDSTPSARLDHRGSAGTEHIVNLLRELPEAFSDRAAFTTWIEERGVSRPVAMWLAMNVRPLPNTTRFVFRVDVAGVRAMLDDYFERDSWDVIEHPKSSMQTHFVVGSASDVVDESDLARARRCPETTVDVVDGAGHWVHIDAPGALRDIVLARLG
ncbi:MAG: alpha/beta hydrolase [Polyangiaceae bacterium]|nr:alpha/beta hydrolase [Polyangiaceae bacterium]